jgi:hypothetical protein
VSSLTYREKMSISQGLLERIRLRLTGKPQEILPADGAIYDQDPVEISLVGGLASPPDPTYPREQPPCAMGMVLLVEPDAKGSVSVSVCGRFDVTHRYIPTLATMTTAVLVGAAGTRNQQRIPECYKRFTVPFTDIVFQLNVADVNQWAEYSLDPAIQSLHTGWESDQRLFRLGRSNDRGYVNTTIPWQKDQCTTDEDFTELVRRSLFVSDGLLLHSVRLRARLRHPPPHFDNTGSRYLLEIYLENDTLPDTSRAYGLNRPYLLDAEFEARILAGRQFDVPHRLQPEEYRYQPEDGVAGYGVTCAVRKLSDRVFATDAMPVFAQERVDAPSPEDVGMTMAASFSLLAEKPLDVLQEFLVALRKYSTYWDEVKAKLHSEGNLPECAALAEDRKAFDNEVLLIEDGISLLRTQEPLLRCFRLMNTAMRRAIALQGKSFSGWHLFQLGFILTQIRAIYERHAPRSEQRQSTNIVDVLWFSTGGGKTEAYLGIITLGMFYARLNGKLYGTTAWMRFPLRMLSAQQFQRLSFVVAQAEMLRVAESIPGHPFTIGYYTGTGSPGRIGRSDGSASDVFLGDATEEQIKQYQFITDCPYCGIKGSVHVVSDLGKVRIKHCCRHPECWTNTSSGAGEHGEGIAGEVGIYVSDEECYRYLPSVLVGTVDKLAVIAHNERFAGYLGAFRYFCPEHGFTATSQCKHQRIRKAIQGSGYESADCGNNTRTSKIRTLLLPRMEDPGFSFLIQDELHLLKESLGNFDAHYETLLQALQVGHGGQQAKVLAATATIKDFENHIHHLYMRPARRFPAPGAIRGESFYARISRDNKGCLVRRWFAGILPLNFYRDGTDRAATEVASRYLDQIDEWLHRLHSNDLSVMAEIGIEPQRAPLVRDYLGKYLNTDLIYANQKRQTTSIRDHLENINQRGGQARTAQLLDGQTSLDDILNAIHHVETKSPDDPMRHLVATSVVSHGVDIAELNFMVLDGWPRSTAEYIQSSARAGRIHPGIVMSILSPGKLFETGVFLNFGDYHFFLDKLVDSVPINRFAPNVMQRTLPGVFSAVVLNWAKHQAPWGSELNRYASKLHQALNDTNTSTRQHVRTMLLNALEVPADVAALFDIRVLTAFRKQLEAEVDRGLHRLQNLSAANADKDLSATLESIFRFAPMRSFRDIENQIEILPSGPKEQRVLKALGR